MLPSTFLYPAGGVLVSQIILALLLVKALLPIVVTLLGMVTEVRELQPLKADRPIVVTLLGMVTEVRKRHCLKALLPIDVTLSPIITRLIPLFPHGPPTSYPSS